jgi:flagellar biosynthesis protein
MILASTSPSKPLRKKAVALQYNRAKQGAPNIAAKGQGEVANTIIRLAKEHNIPIREDADLVELLSKVELNQEIPPNLYKAVAEVFSFLYKMTNKKTV